VTNEINAIRNLLNGARIGIDRRLLWIISYHHACNDGTLMALVAILPILVREMDLSYSEVGILGLGLLITVVVQFAVGKASDRRFSRYMLEIGALLMGISFLIVPLAYDFATLFAAVILMRAGASFYHPIGISWITKEYRGQYMDTALGIQSGLGNLGVILALGTSGMIGGAFGWQTPCLIWAALNMIAVILGLSATKGYEPSHANESSPQTGSASRTMRKIGIMALPIAAGGALYQVTSYFGPINLTEMHGWSAGDADMLFAVWIGVGTVTSYFFGRFSETFGHERVLRMGYAVSCVGVVALAFLSSWYLMLPVILLYGGAVFLTYPAVFAVISGATNEEERGTAFGLLFGFQLGGGALVVALCGAISDILEDPSYSFIIVGILSFASLAALPLWHRR
jgi:FSR family fosmidomycin resistance protein-like MFS transporter